MKLLSTYRPTVPAVATPQDFRSWECFGPHRGPRSRKGSPYSSPPPAAGFAHLVQHQSR